MFDFFKKKDEPNENTEQKQESSKSFWNFSFENLKKTSMYIGQYNPSKNQKQSKKNKEYLRM